MRSRITVLWFMLLSPCLYRFVIDPFPLYLFLHPGSSNFLRKSILFSYKSNCGLSFIWFTFILLLFYPLFFQFQYFLGLTQFWLQTLRVLRRQAAPTRRVSNINRFVVSNYKSDLTYELIPRNKTLGRCQGVTVNRIAFFPSL